MFWIKGADIIFSGFWSVLQKKKKKDFQGKMACWLLFLVCFQ